MYGLDAENGKLLWKTKVDEHPVAQITGAPTLWRKGGSTSPWPRPKRRTAGYDLPYPCCSFRGSDGARCEDRQAKNLEDVHHSRPACLLTIKSAKGVQHYVLRHGAVWAAPTVDTKGTMRFTSVPAMPIRNRLFTAYTDAGMALDMDTGRGVWSVQDTEDDAWLSGCGDRGVRQPGRGISENCPKPLGPDYGFRIVHDLV